MINNGTADFFGTPDATFSATGTGSGSTSTTSATPVTGPDALSTFEGAGTYTVDFKHNIAFGAAPNEFLTGVTLQPTSEVTVNYTYTPAGVPEPSTWAMLLLLGGVGLGGRSLRHRRVCRAH